MTAIANEQHHDLDSSAPSPAHGGKGLMTGALAAIVTLAMAGVVFAIGMQLATYDEQRSHIPGHWFYRAFVLMPAVVQLAYVLPAWRAARKRQHVAVARGVAAGAVIALVLNLLMAGFLAWVAVSMATFD